jgi:hypothetical protein
MIRDRFEYASTTLSRPAIAVLALISNSFQITLIIYDLRIAGFNNSCALASIRFTNKANYGNTDYGFRSRPPLPAMLSAITLSITPLIARDALFSVCAVA